MPSQPRWEGSLKGRMDTCVCMAESLCCPLGTITTLLIGYRPNTGASQVTKVVKNLPASAGDVGDVGLIPASGRSPWRRAWQPTPAFLPGESHGQRSLNGYSLWGHKEPNTTEVTKHSHTQADDRGRHMWEGCRERWRLQVT